MIFYPRLCQTRHFKVQRDVLFKESRHYLVGGAVVVSLVQQEVVCKQILVMNVN